MARMWRRNELVTHGTVGVLHFCFQGRISPIFVIMLLDAFWDFQISRAPGICGIYRSWSAVRVSYGSESDGIPIASACLTIVAREPLFSVLGSTVCHGLNFRRACELGGAKRGRVE